MRTSRGILFASISLLCACSSVPAPTSSTTEPSEPPATLAPLAGPGVYTASLGSFDSYALMAFPVLDSAGVLYLSDPTRNIISMVSTDGEVSTFAGSGEAGSMDGTSEKAAFDHPTGLAFSPSGELYVADTGNNLIRKISTDGEVSTFARGGTVQIGDDPSRDVPLDRPTGLAFSPSGELYVADTGNNWIRRADSAGNLDRTAGLVIGEMDSDDATWARYSAPTGLAFSPSGELYVADTMNRRLVRLSQGEQYLTSFGFAGSGEAMVSEGTGTQASFVYPTGLTVSPKGVLYIGDFGANRVRTVLKDNEVSTPSWSNKLAVSPQRYHDRLLLPEGVAAGPNGTIYVADTLNNRIAIVNPDGRVSTFAGSGRPGFADGSASSARFSYPSDLAFAPDGNLLVADTGNNRIRRVALDGTVSTVAGGTGDDTGPKLGSPALGSFVVRPIAVTVDDSGLVYVADWGNHRIVKFTIGGPLDLVAGSIPKGYEDGIAEAAKFRRPSGLALLDNQTLLVSDATNGYLRSIDTAYRTSTVAGSGWEPITPLIGPARESALNMPHGLAVLPESLVLVADYGFNRIVSFDGSEIRNLTGSSRGSLDGSLAEARFYYPTDLALAEDGTVLVADTGNSKIRRIVLR